MTLLSAVYRLDAMINDTLRRYLTMINRLMKYREARVKLAHSQKEV